MEIAGFIQQYGYAAVALGSFLEGEAILLAGSLAASQGHLDPIWVVAIAAFASFLGDLPYFFAGRRYGEGALSRWPSLRDKKTRFEGMLHRHHVPMVLVLRFLYGLRIAGLLALGMSRIGAVRFLLLDFVGACIWASAICAAGYGAGQLLQVLAARAGSVEGLTMLFVTVACSSVFYLTARRRLTSWRRDDS